MIYAVFYFLMTLSYGQGLSNKGLIILDDFSNLHSNHQVKSGPINQKRSVFSNYGRLSLNGADIRQTYISIHPDTNLISVFNGMVGGGGVPSIGQVFDPKSPLWYDKSTSTLYSISADAQFTIDTFSFYGTYLRPQQTSVNDTLNIQFFLQPNMDYWEDSLLTFYRAFCLPEYNPSLGRGVKEDTTISIIFNNNTAQGWDAWGTAVGLRVPAGYEVAVAMNFIPGSPYSSGDTTGIFKTNPDRVEAGNVNAFWWEGILDLDNNHHEGYYNYSFGVYNNQYDPWGLDEDPYLVLHQTAAFVITHDDFTGIKEEKNSKLVIYPNPAKEYVILENDMEGSAFELLDHSGRLLYSQVLKRGENRIDLKNISSGLYFVRIDSKVQRLVIR